MYEVMTIKDAKMKLAQCEINLEYWLNEKEIAINSVMPKSKGFGSEVVSGGTREDKYKKLDYAIDEIDPMIDYLNKEISNLNNFIEQSLKVIEEYEPLERKIIELRDIKKMKWRDISSITSYSERSCQRIYDKYCKRVKKRRSNVSWRTDD